MTYRTRLSCPIQQTIALIGDKWKIIVICTLKDGTKRFGELQRALDGITPKVLTRQLRDLERDGIVQRTIFPEVPPRVEYTLTPLGRSLFPILDQLHEWAAKNSAALLARHSATEEPAA